MARTVPSYPASCKLPSIGGAGAGFRNSLHVASREQRLWRSNVGCPDFSQDVKTTLLVERCQVDVNMRQERFQSRLNKPVKGSEVQRVLLLLLSERDAADRAFQRKQPHAHHSGR